MPPPSKITDIHHIHKKDSPSGTAKELMTQFSDPPLVESIREGETFGIHKVLYQFIEEEIQKPQWATPYYESHDIDIEI